MKSLTLYELSNDYREAAEKLADMELPAQVVTDTLEGLSGDLTTKATNVAMFVQNLDSLAEQIKLAEANMAHRRKVLENRAESIRDYIKSCMEGAGMTKIECPYFKISIKKNPSSVEIDDNAVLPAAFMRTLPPPPPVPDKKRIAEYIVTTGDVIDGVRIVQRTRIEIK